MENVPGTVSRPDAEREDARLAALHRYALMDTPAEEDFDDLTRLAAEICETPVALMTLLDDSRQWFKSRVGTDIAETPIDLAFCRYALDSPDLLHVPDLTQDARFAKNPLVAHDPHARFYAGAPLVTPDGYVLGTLCVLDFQPRRLSDAQRHALQALSRQAMAQMELRRRFADERHSQEALKSAQQQLHAVIDSAPLVLFALDSDGTFTLSEGKGLEAIGLEPAEVVGQSVWNLYAGESEMLGVIRDVFEGHPRASVQEVGGVAFESHYTPLRDDMGMVTGLMGVALDITERRRTEDALLESEARFRRAFDDAPIGLCLAGEEGRFLQVNRALCDLVGYTEEEMLGLTFPEITHPEDVDTDVQQHRLLLSGHIQNYAMEKRYLHKAGHVVWIQLSVSLVRSEPGRPSYSIAQIQDITQRRALEEERERLLTQTEALLTEALERADCDPLTGLLNHRAFHKKLAEECVRARQTGQPVAVAMLDLDSFRFFNDAYGHMAGDDVLRRAAQALRQNSRPEDTVARFGGDQFALLLPGLDSDEAAALVRCLTDALSETGYRPEGADVAIPLCFSSGIAVYPHDAETRLEVLERADERLRRAKSGADDGQTADRIRARVSRSIEGFSMLDALVTAVDNKDRYTRRHSEDVLTYSLQIASALGLDEKTQHTIGVAALLHDVGKIGVPDRILRKPAKLDDDEFRAVRQHPMMGAIIVGAVPGLEDTLDAVRHHHERWDGDGYPFGLRGEETPLTARLMAVADAFSAMTTDRPYRKGMPHAKALAILQDGAGTQWDARCVEAFLSIRR